jgi:protocatechuate 3,4-dioxygenase beta subunit
LISGWQILVLIAENGRGLQPPQAYAEPSAGVGWHQFAAPAGTIAMPQFNDTQLTAAVVDSFENTPNPRAKFLLQELVKALHDYVRRTDLTFAEWEYAIDFLTRTGQKCSDIRQEFILLSDVLGVSMLVDAVNHRDRDGATETTVLGPFYVGEHKVTAHGTDISSNLDGERMFVQSRVTDLSGKPLAGVPVDVWHADDDGYYDSQKPFYGTEGPSSRARFITDADGRFFFRTILPCSYPIPTDGPVGEMIVQTKRHPMRPAHVHFLVNAPGYEPLITHVFIDGDKYLDTDVVFGVKDELIAKIEKHSDGKMPDGRPASGTWHLMTYEFHMKPGKGEAPKPLGVKETEAV